MKHKRFSLWLILASVLTGFAGCAHKQVRLPVTTAVSPSDTSSYMDLESGWKLKILVPLTKSLEEHKPPDAAPNKRGTSTDLAASGESVVRSSSDAIRQSSSVPQVNGNTISLYADSLIGYEISYYAVVRRRGGAVKLKFASASSTANGKTIVEPKPPRLPFLLPRSAQHIRLVYLVVRSTQADHNMAILAAKHLYSLDAFTTRLKANPSVCTTGADDDVSCSWVPAGIAVRPEKEPRQ